MHFKCCCFWLCSSKERCNLRSGKIILFLFFFIWVILIIIFRLYFRWIILISFITVFPLLLTLGLLFSIVSDVSGIPNLKFLILNFSFFVTLSSYWFSRCFTSFQCKITVSCNPEGGMAAFLLKGVYIVEEIRFFILWAFFNYKNTF